jgi:phage terminase Nu1 subunit (DNA packaging protein)
MNTENGNGAMAMAKAAVQYVTEKVVADLLEISIRTLQDWRIRKEGPPFYQFGASVRYDLAEVLHWAKTRSRDSTWK